MWTRMDEGKKAWTGRPVASAAIRAAICHTRWHISLALQSAPFFLDETSLKLYANLDEIPPDL